MHCNATATAPSIDVSGLICKYFKANFVRLPSKQHRDRDLYSSYFFVSLPRSVKRHCCQINKGLVNLLLCKAKAKVLNEPVKSINLLYLRQKKAGMNISRPAKPGTSIRNTSRHLCGSSSDTVYQTTLCHVFPFNSILHARNARQHS
jgi:hypothetical protein